MQKRTLLVFVAAIVLGFAAVYLVNQLLKRGMEKREAVETMATTSVVVAAVDLGVGTRLTRDALRVVRWPAENALNGSFASVDDLLSKEPPIVLKEIRKGEPVLAYKLSPHGARGGLNVRIPPHQRAITISVNAVRGVAGFVLPGDRVDVLYTAGGNGPGKRGFARTLLQDVRVLGVDQVSSEKENEPKVVRSVTLLVTPEEGKKLALAQEVGVLSLVLRNEADKSIASSGSVTAANLRYTRRAGAPDDSAKGPRNMIEVVRGLRIEEQDVGE